jgi:hypothetical protein
VRFATRYTRHGISNGQVFCRRCHNRELPVNNRHVAGGFLPTARGPCKTLRCHDCLRKYRDP